MKGKRRRRKRVDFETPLESLQNLMEALRSERGGRGALGLLRGTAAWVRVGNKTSFCLGRCCVGRFMPSWDSALQEAVDRIDPWVPTTSTTTEASAPTPNKDDEDVHWYRLSLEEAFFLLHCLRCLELRDLGSTQECPALSSRDCWSRFLRLQPTFLKTYVCYQHFRAEGYIVKSGIYYGCTHVLYKSHPTVNHSEYCVLAILQDRDKVADKVDADDVAKEEDFVPYEDLQSLVRVSVNVKKKLVLLYVFCPPAGEGPDQLDVDVLQSVEIDEFVVSRWLPGSAPEG